MTKEFLQSPDGAKLLQELALLKIRAEGTALSAARQATKPFDEVRYQVGIADGIARAIDLLENMKKPQV